MSDGAFSPQAFLLRDEGGAGQLGERHRHGDGKMPYVAIRVKNAKCLLKHRRTL